MACSWRSVLLLTIAIQTYAAEPAIIEAVRNGNLEQLQALIASGSNLNVRGAQNQTALHEAAASCNVDAARALVQAGLDRTALDSANRRPLDLVVTCRDTSLTRLLAIPRATAPNTNARWTLQGAAARGDASVVDMFLKLGADVNAVNANGDRALEAACRKGDARIVQMLLDRGADLKLTTAAGTTVLHEAALGGSAKVIELLLQRGAAVDAPDQEKGATPLHYAASFGRLDAAKTLLKQRGRPTTQRPHRPRRPHARNRERSGRSRRHAAIRRSGVMSSPSMYSTC